MSKSLFGSNVANNRNQELRETSDTNTAVAAAVAAAAAARKEQREQEQVRALFELGLLGRGDKPKKREKGRDKDKVIPSGPGARVPGLHPKKGTLLACLLTPYLPAGLPRLLHCQT